ncbi:hypothetical protein NDS46_24330 [Paenibacillus thiaminolyticus]|uniref:hypothetical protein n=1 Tax=Paenibacillus thiaminolyticus TaxID=49283 RepID=UPI00232D6C17|nr:hypothetical protein [Paenibacillus thiaminolyticus]WCF07414.1 hypothetical protein NDS46_24330 [Paenibacillus thiaminolyticus]
MGTLPNPDYLRDMLAQVMRLLVEQGLSDKVLTDGIRPPIREFTNNTVYKPISPKPLSTVWKNRT